MDVQSVRFVFVAVCLLACWTHALQPDAEAKNFITQNISQKCFGCICEAASGCDRTTSCNGDVCGPFRITWAYWADGGKPTLNDEPSGDPLAFSRCVNDPYCAAKAVQGYMNRYAQDCNHDGKIDCDDYVRIHRLGGNSCGGNLEGGYEGRYRQCAAAFNVQSK